MDHRPFIDFCCLGNPSIREGPAPARRSARKWEVGISPWKHSCMRYCVSPACPRSRLAGRRQGTQVSLFVSRLLGVRLYHPVSIKTLLSIEQIQCRSERILKLIGFHKAFQKKRILDTSGNVPFFVSKSSLLPVNKEDTHSRSP
jgi:hypothetical protein